MSHQCPSNHLVVYIGRGGPLSLGGFVPNLEKWPIPLPFSVNPPFRGGPCYNGPGLQFEINGPAANGRVRCP